MTQVALPELTPCDCSLKALPRLAELKEATRTVRAEVCLERVRHLTTYLRDLADRNDPPVLQYAKALRCYLSNKAPRFFDANLLAGTTTSKRLGVPVLPELLPRGWGSREGSLTALETEELERLLPYWVAHPEVAAAQTLLPRILAFIAGAGEAAADPKPWQRVVLDRGLEGIMAEAEAEERSPRRQGSPQDSERLVFLQAVREVLAGVSAYAANLGQFASLLAAAETDAETDAERRSQLGAMADVCAQVPARPARSFREAVNAVWLLQVGLAPNACLDAFPTALEDLIQPWFQQDLERGRLTETEALELLGCLWLKLHDHVDPVSGMGKDARWFPEQPANHPRDLARLAGIAAGLLGEPGRGNRRRSLQAPGLEELWRSMGLVVGASLRLAGAPSYR